jgi:hypothetical protein
MHHIDRIIRVVVAAILIYFGFIETSWVTSELIPMILGLFGVANLLAGLSGFCPIYVLANLDFSGSGNTKTN